MPSRGTRYGDEEGWAEVADESPCHDCGVTKGQLHVPGCDVAICTRCGEQMIWCGGCPELDDVANARKEIELVRARMEAELERAIKENELERAVGTTRH
jgi:hypothetical protein